MEISRKEFLKGTALAGLACRTLWAEDEAIANKGTTRFVVAPRRLMLRHTWTISRNSSDYKDNVFLRIERDGVVGWGEAAPNARYGQTPDQTLTSIQRARPLFEAGDWFQYADMRQEWERIVPDQSCACAALDMALVDWVGRRFQAPLYRLLGLDRSKTPITTFSIGIDAPEVIEQKVREAEGFPVLKIKVGLDNDAEILAAVRRVTGKPLRADANEGWRDKEQALERIRWLQDMGVELIEQPLPAAMLEETAWLRRRVDIPIIADEAVHRARDIPKVAGAYDGVNVKLMKAGGLQEAIRMIHVARALDMKVMLGCMIESSVAVSAAAHLSPLVDYADLDGNLLIAHDPFVGVAVEQGRLVLNDLPGLGIKEREA
jgi:L-alanine-DL-glutamate epimerase-like enolase superfamily enzyme